MNFKSLFTKNKLKTIILVIVLFISGSLTLQAQALGDANDDGNISIIDALVVAQYYVGLNPGTFVAASADVNGSRRTEPVKRNLAR